MGESDPPPTRANKGQTAQTKPDKESSDDEDDYGPTLGSDTKQPRALGPTYARADDLQSRDGMSDKILEGLPWMLTDP